MQNGHQIESEIKHLILSTILNQRNVLYKIRSGIDLSRTDMEVLCFADTEKLFNVYQLQKFFSHTNVQQLRRAVKKLHNNGLLEIIRQGIRNKPSIYCLAYKGEEILVNYISAFFHEN